MRLKDAYDLGIDLLTQLSSACVRIEIRGSICRQKPEVGDIDLVCIPSMARMPVHNMFDEVVDYLIINHLDDALASLYLNREWELDQIHVADGAKLKRLRHVITDLTCDLTITDERRWCYWSAVRTGPGEFSKGLMQRALIRKMFWSDALLHNHPPVYDDARKKVLPCPSGDRCLRIIPTLEERDVFAAFGLAYIEPADRTLAAIMRPVPVG